MNSVNIETELKLVVIADRPDLTARSISELRVLGPFALIEPHEIILNDAYFDSPNGALGRKSWALRLRESSGEVLICLKGKSRVLGGGAIARTEIEQKWSEEARCSMERELKSLGVIEKLPAGRCGELTLMDAGLIPIQRRRTERNARSIAIPSAEGGIETVAELAVDTSIFRFGPIKVVHYEVEIELYPGGDEAILGDAARELTRRFPNELERKSWNKLALGRALETLLRENRPERLLTTQNTPTRATYACLDVLLSR
jgi:inorganic triphosphatase YgiF